jgi:Asp-tRNA(Asn)/Glu-tRNA(Gln) amidotransferase C subunit
MRKVAEVEDMTAVEDMTGVEVMTAVEVMKNDIREDKSEAA